MSKRLEKATRLRAQGQLDEAERLCRSSIKLGQDIVGARKLLSVCLYDRSVMLCAQSSCYPDAQACLSEAIRLNPDFPDALNNLGSLLLVMHRPDEALAPLERSVELTPGKLDTLQNLALAQEAAGAHEAASATLHRLAELDGANRAGYLIREALLIPSIAPSEEAIQQARASALDKLRRLQARDDLRLEDPLRHPSTYFRFSYHGRLNTEFNRTLAAVYAKACPGLQWTAPHVPAWRAPARRIRVGIASGFLRVHSIGSVSRGFFEFIDRTRFEVIAIHLGHSAGDEAAQAIDRAADAVLEVQSGQLELAREAVARLELDVLFYQDIGMEPLSYFLAFARLAPIQITWFGHPDTTGIPTLDQFVSSALFERGNAQAHYTEQLVTLPVAGNVAYYHRPPMPPQPPGREHFGLGRDQRVYCCPQQLFKIQPAMDRLFLGIVELDPKALIVLFETAERHLRVALEARLTALSPALVTRVRFLPTQPYASYLQLLAMSDVVLDTVHFNGYNTTLETFAMNTPVVTLAGTMQRERFGYGLYQAIDFMDLVADSPARFVELAVRVANDPDFRAQCSRRIAAGAQTLFENTAAIRSFETAVLGLVQSKTASAGC